jgi:hypothetical protein
MPEQRAIVDLRLHVTGHTTEHVYQLLTDYLEHARQIAPPEIDVRYTQLRPAKRSRTFDANMEPAKR